MIDRQLLEEIDKEYKQLINELDDGLDYTSFVKGYLMGVTRDENKKILDDRTEEGLDNRQDVERD